MNNDTEYEKASVITQISKIKYDYKISFNVDEDGKINVSLISEIVNFVKQIGNCGVDIFLFLSGIGLYLSMTKNNLRKYYKNIRSRKP